MKKISPRHQLKVLLALTAAVLLTHLALLQAPGMSLGLSQPEPLRAFNTRVITPTPLAALEPAAKPLASPKRKAAAPARTKKQVSAAPPLSDREMAPQAPVAVEEQAPPTRPDDATPQDPPPSDADQLPAVPRPPRDQLYTVSTFTVPGSVRFHYEVRTNKFPFSAKAELLWRQDGESYDARLEISAFGQARVQNSRGQITPAGLAPIRFSDKFRSEVAAHFNREQGKVTFSANTPDVPLLAGAQDRLSVLVQLAAMIAGDPGHFPPATTLAIQTIGPRDADTWLFTVGEEEKLTLPGGEQLTLKLVRNPRQEFDQKVELWLAPALGYLPARIRITEPNGDFVDQQWLATEQPG
ncbi:MAG: DUF3108 domain-containing protein [Rhodoferax sp.]|uniref:DUF3108 domain-containing protein n=1 Tax=Rhodoferax sp. TaxID=50421 RepID=UPI0017E0B719|nr:DUF3108 domain-containing protein [Rhodoferax sp.]NMM14826.1 DUF3108 domain-containing protein [Rhodoferax sp.]NMM18589.1 DUF3108 domain-containing protein [Rhodoferax sp.]